MMIFGIIGYLFRKFDYEAAPLILAFVLGPMLELNLRQSLIFSKGSFGIFFARPISAVAIIIAMILLIIPIVTYFIRRKKQNESMGDP